MFPYLIVVQHDELGAVELLLLGLHGLHGLLHDLLEGGGLGVGARHLTGLGNGLGLGPGLRLGLSLQHIELVAQNHDNAQFGIFCPFTDVRQR